MTPIVRCLGGLRACYLPAFARARDCLSSGVPRRLLSEPRRRVILLLGGAQGEASAGADVSLRAERLLRLLRPTNGNDGQVAVASGRGAFA